MISDNRKTAIEIIYERYTSGEVSDKEYERIRRKIADSD